MYITARINLSFWELEFCWKITWLKSTPKPKKLRGRGGRRHTNAIDWNENFSSTERQIAYCYQTGFFSKIWTPRSADLYSQWHTRIFGCVLFRFRKVYFSNKLLIIQVTIIFTPLYEYQLKWWLRTFELSNCFIECSIEWLRLTTKILICIIILGFGVMVKVGFTKKHMIVQINFFLTQESFFSILYTHGCSQELLIGDWLSLTF